MAEGVALDAGNNPVGIDSAGGGLLGGIVRQGSAGAGSSSAPAGASGGPRTGNGAGAPSSSKGGSLLGTTSAGRSGGGAVGNGGGAAASSAGILGGNGPMIGFGGGGAARSHRDPRDPEVVFREKVEREEADEDGWIRDIPEEEPRKIVKQELVEEDQYHSWQPGGSSSSAAPRSNGFGSSAVGAGKRTLPWAQHQQPAKRETSSSSSSGAAPHRREILDLADDSPDDDDVWASLPKSLREERQESSGASGAVSSARGGSAAPFGAGVKAEPSGGSSVHSAGPPVSHITGGSRATASSKYHYPTAPFAHKKFNVVSPPRSPRSSVQQPLAAKLRKGSKGSIHSSEGSSSPRGGSSPRLGVATKRVKLEKEESDLMDVDDDFDMQLQNSASSARRRSMSKDLADQEPQKDVDDDEGSDDAAPVPESRKFALSAAAIQPRSNGMYDPKALAYQQKRRDFHTNQKSTAWDRLEGERRHKIVYGFGQEISKDPSKYSGENYGMFDQTSHQKAAKKVEKIKTERKEEAALKKLEARGGLTPAGKKFGPAANYAKGIVAERSGEKKKLASKDAKTDEEDEEDVVKDPPKNTTGAGKRRLQQLLLQQPKQKRQQLAKDDPNKINVPKSVMDKPAALRTLAEKNLIKEARRQTQRVNDDVNEDHYLAELKAQTEGLGGDLEQETLADPKKTVWIVKNEVRVPAYIWNQLYGYQKTGVRWMFDLHQRQVGGILADEMGLGKTIQIVAFLAALHCSGILQTMTVRGNGGAGAPKTGGILIACPATLVEQWRDEIKSWYPIFHVSCIQGTQIDKQLKNEMCAKAVKNNGIVITSYETLARHEQDVYSYPWVYCILDEAHKVGRVLRGIY